ncbi:hypothetical protein [Butyrivibrio sp. YAB3001]|uniref:hypothetical protein n=1 Tax=Butyrivibrio sp. YAB3001 TaxID=1520812 RepID=UPI0008F662BE|nr:hypothetical protein [Butyrivibrio sp. YAB3001]SFB73494.1 hypothetical protein SAMN02910398_00512 [Butyrivibrio sp. YAB3001]
MNKIIVQIFEEISKNFTNNHGKRENDTISDNFCRRLSDDKRRYSLVTDFRNMRWIDKFLMWDVVADSKLANGLM